MTPAILVVCALLVLVFSGLMAMAGLGAAFLFVPLFYYLGVPLPEATPAALLLNVVSLVFASANYWRARLVSWRVGFPVLVTAVALSPAGARLTPHVDRRVLLACFAGLLMVAGALMLFHRARQRESSLGRSAISVTGAGVGAVAGFLGGLLGVGGGNFILPVLTWMGLDTKVAAGTTATVVVFASLAGFLGHATLGRLDPTFLAITAVAAGVGSILGSQLVKTKVSSAQLKKVIGGLLWLIASKMLFDALR